VIRAHKIDQEAKRLRIMSDGVIEKALCMFERRCGAQRFRLRPDFMAVRKPTDLKGHKTAPVG